MLKEWSYIKDSGDFIKKIYNLDLIPKNAILVTVELVGLYPSIPYEVILRERREALDHSYGTIIENGRVCA